MIDRVLALVLAVCAAFIGLIVAEFYWDTSDAPGLPPRPVAVADQPMPRSIEPKVENLVAIAVAAPLFSATRRPPEQARADAAPDLPDIRLTGIVIEPDRRMAIFAITGAKPMIRSEGETLNDWRLDNISPHAVSLIGPAGTRTLEPKPDRNLVRPTMPGQTAAQAKPGGVAAANSVARPGTGFPVPSATRPPPPLPPMRPFARPVAPSTNSSSRP